MCDLSLNVNYFNEYEYVVDKFEFEGPIFGILST